MLNTLAVHGAREVKALQGAARTALAFDTKSMAALVGLLLFDCQHASVTASQEGE